MRILIYGINYYPELTGIGKYTGEMGAWLASKGHTVTVVTALPYYPEWKIRSAYRSKGWHSEMEAGVKIYRCPLYVPSVNSSAKRIIHEFSFFLSAIPVLVLNLFQKKNDIILCVSPPFHLGLLAIVYSRLKKARLITHIQDLQIDAASDLGMIKNKTVLKVMFGLERFILRNSHAVSSISDGMIARIEKKGIPAGKTLFFPNWVDTDFIKPLPAGCSLRKRFGYSEEEKIIMYSGNLGEKQGLEILIGLAAYFKSQPEIQFLIVGDGGGQKKLKRLSAEAGLINLKFFPLQAYEDLPALLSTASLHLVLQKRSASDLVMPSKLVSILAAGGVPLVTAVEGSSLYKLIKEADCGIIIEPESLLSLIEGVKLAVQADLTSLSTNARVYAGLHLAKEPLLKNWEMELKSI